jgi:hypothetical protein
VCSRHCVRCSMRSYSSRTRNSFVDVLRCQVQCQITEIFSRLFVVFVVFFLCQHCTVMLMTHRTMSSLSTVTTKIRNVQVEIRTSKFDPRHVDPSIDSQHFRLPYSIVWRDDLKSDTARIPCSCILIALGSTASGTYRTFIKA